MNNECNENGRVSLAASLGDEDLCGDEGLNGCFIYTTRYMIISDTIILSQKS